MRTVGVICEYNPFHRGHLTQFRQIRTLFGEDAAIICLMSGNFVQRGECAVFDKLVRASAAVDCGASLVLELPVTGALRSAEGFARCGVEILDALGVETLAFGSESGETENFLCLASAMDTPEYNAALRAALASGQSSPAAREAAAKSLHLPGELLKTPNNILGLEYCKAALGRRIRPAALHRAGDYHAPTPDAEAPSASSLRAVLEGNGDVSPFVPEAAARRYVDAERHFPQYGERAMLARLRAMTPEDWARTAHGSEGLWSLAMRAAQCCGALQELESMVKSRRYPMTRVRRLLLCAALGLTEDGLRQVIPYVRALAMDGTGRRVLREMRDLETLPIINAGQTPEDKDYFELELRAAGLYGLFGEGAVCAPPSRLRDERIYVRRSAE